MGKEVISLRSFVFKWDPRTGRFFLEPCLPLPRLLMSGFVRILLFKMAPRVALKAVMCLPEKHVVVNSVQARVRVQLDMISMLMNQQ